MAIIWMAVLNLATVVTGTLTRVPARNSRRPETRISRDRMMTAGTSRSRLRLPVCGLWVAKVPSATSIISATATSTLSAMGSNMRPKSDPAFSLRAAKPSSQSLTPAITKTPKATSRAASPGSTKATTKIGTSTIRRTVRALGRANMMPV